MKMNLIDQMQMDLMVEELEEHQIVSSMEQMTHLNPFAKLDQMKIQTMKGPLQPKKLEIDKSSQTYTVYIEFSYLNSTQLLSVLRSYFHLFCIGILLQI